MKIQADVAAEKMKETVLGNVSNNIDQANIPVSMTTATETVVDQMQEEEYPEEEVDFNCSDDPDYFAKRVGLSSQRIREIDKEVGLEDSDKENRAPSLVEIGIQHKEASGGMVNSDPIKKIQIEAQDRIKKAKAKAEVDEAAIRRSVRNKKNEDQHAMERCEDMTKKKKLESVPERRAAKASILQGLGEWRKSRRRSLGKNMAGIL